MLDCLFILAVHVRNAVMNQVLQLHIIIVNCCTMEDAHLVSRFICPHVGLLAICILFVHGLKSCGLKFSKIFKNLLSKFEIAIATAVCVTSL